MTAFDGGRNLDMEDDDPVITERMDRLTARIDALLFSVALVVIGYFLGVLHMAAVVGQEVVK